MPFLHAMPACREMNVTVPESTRKNGSLYAHVFLGPEGKSPLQYSDRQHMSVVTVPLTKYAVPEASTFNLFTSSFEVCHLLLRNFHGKFL